MVFLGHHQGYLPLEVGSPVLKQVASRDRGDRNLTWLFLLVSAGYRPSSVRNTRTPQGIKITKLVYIIPFIIAI